MIKKLSILFALCSIFAVSGCAMLDFSGIKSSDGDPEVESERVVALLHDNISSSSLGEFDEYFAMDEDTEKMYNDITEASGVRKDFDVCTYDIGNHISEETEERWFEIFKSRFFGNSSYVIDNITVDGEEIEVDVTMSVPDFSKVQLLQNEEIDEMIEECFSIDINDSDLFFEELALRKGMEEDELRALYSSSDEDLYIKDIYELFSDELEKLFGMVIGAMLENCPQESYKLQYTVEKQEDETYRITDVDGE